jgi:Protein of unknown function (DUF3108)
MRLKALLRLEPLPLRKMKDLLHKFILFLSFAVVFVVTGAAQNGGKADPRSMPFVDGETLTYEGKVSKNIIRGIAIADLTFTINQPAPDGDYTIKADARSKGTLIKLFRYSFLYQIDSTIGSNEFRVNKTVKRDTQKDRVRDSEAVFDYKKERVTYVETDPKQPMRPPRKIASEIGPEAHDLVSGLYSLRLLPLAIGKSFELEVSDSGLVYKIPVKVTARVKQKSVLGNVWCFRVEPDVFGPDRLIEKEGSMIIWITDDARRIPIRSQVNTSIGRVEIKLKTVKNIRP